MSECSGNEPLASRVRRLRTFELAVLISIAGLVVGSVVSGASTAVVVSAAYAGAVTLVAVETRIGVERERLERSKARTLRLVAVVILAMVAAAAV